MDRPRLSPVPRAYLVAVLATAAAAGLRLALSPLLGKEAPLILAIFPVVAAAWAGGLRPGLLAMVLSGTASALLFLPWDGYALAYAADYVRLVIFLIMGTLTSLMVGALHTSRTRAEREADQRRQVEEGLRDWKARYEAAARVSGHVLYDSDLETGQVVYGGECAALLGYAAAELDGPVSRWIELVHPEDRGRFTGGYGATRVAGGAFHLEYRVRHKEGRTLRVQDDGQPIFGTDGRPVRVVGFVKDVTQRRQMEDELRASEQRFRAAVENLPHGFIIYDAQRRFVYMNRRGQEAGGRDLAALVGRRDEEVWPEAFTKNYLPALQRAAQTRTVQTFEWTLPQDLGGRTLVVTYVPLTGPAGDLQQILAITYDITERKAAEERLREADRQKDRFLATLGHELRNPLAPLRNALQIVRQPSGAAAATADALALMDRQVDRMARLIDDLLDVSRISRGKVHLRRERIELGDLVRHAVETSRPHADRLGHRLTVVLPPEPILLDADPVRLEQVLANLLDNACKYTGRGGRIAVTACRHDGEAVVAVRDDGRGLSPEQVPHLFEMFSQGEPGPNEAQAGLGIGLALARGLVEMHGGRIEAASEGPGRGSEFTVRLPALPPGAAPAPERAVSRHPAAAAPRRRVLVVDDNRDSADSMTMLLRLRGHEVRTVYDGETALTAAAEFRPEVVLLDIGLPRLDGYEVARRLRAAPGGGAVLLAAMTGYGTDDDKHRARQAGFDRHMTKPVDPDALHRLLAGEPADEDD